MKHKNGTVSRSLILAIGSGSGYLLRENDPQPDKKYKSIMVILPTPRQEDPLTKRDLDNFIEKANRALEIRGHVDIEYISTKRKAGDAQSAIQSLYR